MTREATKVSISAATSPTTKVSVTATSSTPAVKVSTAPIATSSSISSAVEALTLSYALNFPVTTVKLLTSETLLLGCPLLLNLTIVSISNGQYADRRNAPFPGSAQLSSPRAAPWEHPEGWSGH